jgi:hypothetical protein
MRNRGGRFDSCVAHSVPEAFMKMKVFISESEIKEIIQTFLREKFDLGLVNIRTVMEFLPDETPQFKFTGMDVDVLDEVVMNDDSDSNRVRRAGGKFGGI